MRLLPHFTVTWQVLLYLVVRACLVAVLFCHVKYYRIWCQSCAGVCRALFALEEVSLPYGSLFVLC